MLEKEIEIPEGSDVIFEKDRLNAKGAKGEVSRMFRHPHINLKVEKGKVTLTSAMERRKVKATMGTWNAHIKNMFLGVAKGWKGELKLVYSHFPVKLKLEENTFVIENFLGERNPRSVPIPEDLKVEVDKNTIYVSGADKERVGQLCARIEQTAKVKGYDRRIFQDGIYITRKPYLEGECERGKDES
ncbi:MAG: 50S ribosomal protein L6 [Candidatus Aenigmarchaeota archaeon]|nr:50S ribosomal protein L6 [Candidatus Aenigmarchaeota archaeon]MCK4532089.1 50S ribosomal protein L6 [Candidatus Aenigmarchaeota archaeon]